MGYHQQLTPFVPLKTYLRRLTTKAPRWLGITWLKFHVTHFWSHIEFLVLLPTIPIKIVCRSLLPHGWDVLTYKQFIFPCFILYAQTWASFFSMTILQINCPPTMSTLILFYCARSYCTIIHKTSTLRQKIPYKQNQKGYK